MRVTLEAEHITKALSITFHTAGTHTSDRYFITTHTTQATPVAIVMVSGAYAKAIDR